MNGGHDLGGKCGLGPVNPETDEPVFHSEWERRVFALTLASGMLGHWNIDESRFARERQDGADYLRHSYYENWLVGLEQLLVEKNLLQDMAEASMHIPAVEDAVKILATGGPTLLASDQAPQFAIGDRVCVRRQSTVGHTRAPGYAQGVTGAVAALHGCHIYPDAHVRGETRGEYLYSVKFSEQSLWGRRRENVEVMIDLWEPYLEIARDNG